MATAQQNDRGRGDSKVNKDSREAKKDSDEATDGSTIYSLRAPDVYCLRSRSGRKSSFTLPATSNDVSTQGQEQPKELRRVRVVCLSDTHGRHWDLFGKIPDGDILVHSGDFSQKLRSHDFERVTADFDRFLSQLPHTHKVVIAGNHEIAFNDYTPQQIASRLPSATYLQDSGCVIEGLRFYGSPWTASSNMGFSCRAFELDAVWEKIDPRVDILITHSPPHNIHDLAYDPHSERAKDCLSCDVCGQLHRRYSHWGSRSLRTRAFEIQPTAHIFGHVHDSQGWSVIGKTLFVNAAQDNKNQPIFFDVVICE